MNIIELYNAPLLTRNSANGSEIAQGVQRLGYGLGLILGGRRDFSLSLQRLQRSSGSTQLHIHWVPGVVPSLNFPLLSSLVKRPELEAEQFQSRRGVKPISRFTTTHSYPRLLNDTVVDKYTPCIKAKDRQILLHIDCVSKWT